MIQESMCRLCNYASSQAPSCRMVYHQDQPVSGDTRRGNVMSSQPGYDIHSSPWLSHGPNRKFDGLPNFIAWVDFPACELLTRW